MTQIAKIATGGVVFTIHADNGVLTVKHHYNDIGEYGIVKHSNIVFKSHSMSEALKWVARQYDPQYFNNWV